LLETGDKKVKGMAELKTMWQKGGSGRGSSTRKPEHSARNKGRGRRRNITERLEKSEKTSGSSYLSRRKRGRRKVD